MGISVDNQDIGPCDVYYDGDFVGSTLDNVVVTIKKSYADLKADQFGSSMLDRAVTGIEISLTTSIAETRDKAKWKMIFPTSTLAGTAPADHIDLGDNVATRVASTAKQLLLHPKVEGAIANKNYDFIIWKAAATEESALTVGPGEQYKMKVVWQALLDTSTTPARMARYGDHTL
jgi:hypothetical protein